MREVPGKKLTLISAPAGYGKTTLLAQWASAARHPLVWLSLDATENDPDTFFRYLLRGWEEVRPGVMESLPGLLLGGMMPDMAAVSTAFINYAADLTDSVAFVLDDYHLIHNPAVHEALAFLLDHAPSTLHFVLAGRSEPPLPIARYRARQELLEVGPNDLQFRPDFGWIDLPVFEEDGYPRQVRGVVADAPGLYFVGLFCLTAAASALVGGSGRDAAYVAKHIAGRAYDGAASQADVHPQASRPSPV